MRIWLILLACGCVTYLTRASFIALGDKASIPLLVERSLRYVGPAAFAAISVPIILGNDAFAEPRDDLPRVIAAAVAGLVIHRTKSVPASLFVGMVTLWLLQWAGL